MADINNRLKEALLASCAHSIEDILAQKSEEDYQELKTLLELDDSIEPQLRHQAVHLLGRWGNTEVVPQLQRLLPQVDELEQINTLNALSQLADAAATETVVEYTKHPSPDVRRFALSGLSRMDKVRAKQVLEEAAKEDAVEFVRAKANALLKR